jgi:hypothetical protein
MKEHFFKLKPTSNALQGMRMRKGEDYISWAERLQDALEMVPLQTLTKATLATHVVNGFVSHALREQLYSKVCAYANDHIPLSEASAQDIVHDLCQEAQDKYELAMAAAGGQAWHRFKVAEKYLTGSEPRPPGRSPDYEDERDEISDRRDRRRRSSDGGYAAFTTNAERQEQGMRSYDPRARTASRDSSRERGRSDTRPSAHSGQRQRSTSPAHVWSTGTAVP